MRIVIATLLVIAALLLVARYAMPNLGQSAAGGVVRETSTDGQTAASARLADCGSSPNCQGSLSSRDEQRVAPFSLHGTSAQASTQTPEQSMDRLVELIEAQPGTAIVAREADYLHATFTSKWMRFVDDVEFLVDAEQKRIDVRSASRLGKSDLGANARRIEALRAEWQS